MTVNVFNGKVSDFIGANTHTLLVAKIKRVSEDVYQLLECQYDYYYHDMWHCYKFKPKDIFWQAPDGDNPQGLLYKERNGRMIEYTMPNAIWNPIKNLYIGADQIYTAFMEARDQELSVPLDESD